MNSSLNLIIFKKNIAVQLYNNKITDKHDLLYFIYYELLLKHCYFFLGRK